MKSNLSYSNVNCHCKIDRSPKLLTTATAQSPSHSSFHHQTIMAEAEHPLKNKRDKVASTLTEEPYRYMPGNEKATHIIKKLAVWTYDQIINGNVGLGGKYGSVLPILMEMTGLGKSTINDAIVSIPKSKSVPILKSSRKPEFTEDDKFAINLICNELHQDGRHPKAKDLLRHFIQRNRGVGCTISDKDFRAFLRSAGLVYGKTRHGLPIIVNTPRIQLWKSNFVRDYVAAVEAGRTVYFLDETFIHSGDSMAGMSWGNRKDPLSHNPKAATSKGSLFMIAGIGSKDGWVMERPDKHALFFEVASNPSDDYHKNMNSHNFEGWMITRVIPHLKRNSVIVMDNVGYHCRIPNKIPSKNAKKSDMCDFILKFGEQSASHQELMANLKSTLYEMCIGLEVPQTYALHDHLKPLGIDMLFLPPYHPIWNPIELQWAQVKGKTKENNTAGTKEMCREEFFKALNVSNDFWPNQIRHCEDLYQESRIAASEEVVENAPSDSDSDDE